jgi:hypothetical protein
VKNSIQQIAEEFINNLQQYFSGDRKIQIDKLENELLDEAKSCAGKMTAAYVELLDHAVLYDKQGRKEEGYIVVRRNDERRVQSKIGEISFRRTYYRNKDTREYTYLADGNWFGSIHSRERRLRIGTCGSRQRYVISESL